MVTETDNRLPGAPLPEAFLDRMKKLLGREYENFVDSLCAERVQGLRLNLLKGSLEVLTALCADRFGLRQVPWCHEGFYFAPETRPGKHPFHEAGVYYIQEPSAMAAGALLNPKPGERVLDLCAAPGGKTTHIAGRMQGRGLLISNEIHPARVRILSQNVERMGVRNCIVTNEASETLRERFPGFFDRIAVDAPCSGEGMFRKDEQARAEWSLENVHACAARQQEILDDAAVMLRPGGWLVYSTCTFAPEENEAGIAFFLQRHPEFSVAEPADEHCTDGLSSGRADWCGAGIPERIRMQISHTFRIWPQLSAGEGHYIALLRKDGEENPGKRKEIRGNRTWKNREGLKIVKECLDDILISGTVDADDGCLTAFGDQIYLLPEGTPELSGLRVLRPGLHLGTLKKNRMEPSHALALALRPEETRAWMELDPEGAQAASYLQGNVLPAGPDRKGWTLVTTGGCSLGWGKVSSGMLKNHYPVGLRKH